MQIKVYKPGASEFKRQKHAIQIYMQVLNCFKEITENNLTWTYLNNNRKNGGRILFDFYKKHQVLKLNSKESIWNDRITSLFKRERLIEVNQNDLMVPSDLGEFILINFPKPPLPFSNSDFKLIVYALLSNQKQSYLITALEILQKSKQLNEDKFMFKFLGQDFAKNYQEIFYFLENNNYLEIAKLLESGSGGKNKDEQKAILSDLKKLNKILFDCFRIESEKMNDFFINQILNFKFHSYGKWNQFKNKALELTFWEENDVLIEKLANKEINITKKIVVRFIYCFALAKKFFEYAYLVKMYILWLPLFKLENHLIKIDSRFANICQNILLYKKEILGSKYSDYQKIYQLIVPKEDKKPLVDIKQFYPQLDEKFLNLILQDNNLWLNRQVNPKYQIILQNLNKKNLPTYYEFLTILFVYKKIIKEPTYYDFNQSINTLLDSQYLPIRFASGGHADGVIKQKGSTIIIEPTLFTGRNQLQFEIGIVDHYQKYQADYCLFISPTFSKKTLNLLEKFKLDSPSSKGMCVIPIKNDELKIKIHNFESIKSLIDNF